MKYITHYAIGLLLIFGMGMAQQSHAQSHEEAAEAFERAVELAENRNFQESVEWFIQAEQIAREVGAEETLQIAEMASERIPQVAFEHFADQIRNQQMEEALIAAEWAIEIMHEYDAQARIQQIERNLPEVYLALGNRAFQNEENEQALEHYNEVLELNPEHERAYFQRAQANRRLGDTDQAMHDFDQAIDYAQQQNNQDILSRARYQAYSYLVYRGAEAIDEERYSEAVELLNRALNYDDQNERAYYRLAEAYNDQGNWQQGLNYAQTALEFAEGSDSELARIYFELGVSYKNLGDEASACDAFSNAAHGDFRDAAEHELEYELDCDQVGNN